jgi:hypothetical protein
MSTDLPSKKSFLISLAIGFSASLLHSPRIFGSIVHYATLLQHNFVSAVPIH